MMSDPQINLHHFLTHKSLDNLEINVYIVSDRYTALL